MYQKVLWTSFFYHWVICFSLQNICSTIAAALILWPWSHLFLLFCKRVPMYSVVQYVSESLGSSPRVWDHTVIADRPVQMSFLHPIGSAPPCTYPYIKKVVCSAKPKRGAFLGKDLTKCLLSCECLTGAWTDPQKQHERTHWLSLCGPSELCNSTLVFLNKSFLNVCCILFFP